MKWDHEFSTRVILWMCPPVWVSDHSYGEQSEYQASPILKRHECIVFNNISRISANETEIEELYDVHVCFKTNERVCIRFNKKMLDKLMSEVSSDQDNIWIDQAISIPCSDTMEGFFPKKYEEPISPTDMSMFDNY